MLYSAMIFVSLWLLQTVFLQTMYNQMIVKKTEKIFSQLLKEKNSSKSDDETFFARIDELAFSNSLMIMLLDSEGNLLYSADEHSFSFFDRPLPGRPPKRESANTETEKSEAEKTEADKSESDKTETAKRGNQPRTGIYHTIPPYYRNFFEKIKEEGKLRYQSQRTSSLILGQLLDDGRVIFLSRPVKAVGAAVEIIRIQLIWVTAVSLVIGFLLSFLLSRRFSKPVSSIVNQSKLMAGGKFDLKFEKEFCTELDELSDTLSQTALALDRLEHSRQELLANVSHDLRTPLTMIRGYAESIRDISGENKVERDEDLGVIIRETERLNDLVNDILEYTSIQDSTPSFSDFDIAETARNVVNQFSHLCENSGVSLDFNAEKNLVVLGNEKQLTRVLYNLIDNAIRHCGEKKRVCVSAKKSDEGVLVQVQDFGDGIPKEQLSQIWDRYFTARQRRSQGTSGLGLSIAKEILEKHNADFGVESEVGEGTCFWFVMKKKTCHESEISEQV